MARWGARGPEWFVRVAPAVVGLVVCALARDRRRAISQNLRRVRGNRGALQHATDVAATFITYASCLTDVLGEGTPRARPSQALVHGELHFTDALAQGRGVVLVTAHTAGWEVVGPMLARDHGRPVMMVEAAERDVDAAAIQDDARRAPGLLVAHVGADPLSALGLVRHLRDGGIVALQIDRAPAGLRSRRVALFGDDTRFPEGPLRLGAMTGAPIVPIFVARTGHRRYEVTVRVPIRLPRSPGDPDLDRAAQEVAAALEEFARAHPTQWFHFRSE
jgi:KDO2-lipid IV(A) lauroyltransferase